MFTAALFVIARTWKQPRCPSTEKMDKKKQHVVHLHNRLLPSCKNNNDIMKFLCKWMELEKKIILSEVNPERQKLYVLRNRF